MGEVFAPEYENWAAGVNTAVEPDQIGPGVSPRGRNTTLVSVGPQHAIVGQRAGVTMQNATPLTGSAAIIGMFDYQRQTAGSFTGYHLLVSDGGRLDKLNADTTTSPADAAAATPFTSGTKIPDFTVANNLCFICNGTENKKFNGTNVQAWGIVAPAVAPTLADSGVAGSHNGTYEGMYTYYNSSTGAESSAGVTSATVTVVSKRIDWTFTVPTDTQADKVRLYIRNTATQAYFYLAAEVAAAVSQPFRTNVLDSTLVTQGPSTTDYNVAPIFSVSEWHNARLLGVGPSAPSFLYYSKLGLPEAQPPLDYERINTDDGQTVVALKSAHEVLLILKQHSTWVLSGTDPASWVITIMDPNIGCVSARSVVVREGVVYWWSDQGPVRWDGTGGPTLIGLPTLAPTLSPDALNTNAWSTIVAAADSGAFPQILWAVPEINQTRNTLLLPWNYRLSCWESDGWTIMDASSLATVFNSSQKPFVYLGGASGQVFQFDHTAKRDGVSSGTAAGMVTSATSTTLTDTTATFLTTGGKLIERYVSAVSSDGLTVQRRRITANTGTVLTVTPAWDSTPNSTWSYLIGGIHMEWDLWEETFQKPFWKKRLEFFFAQAKTTDISVSLIVDFYRNREATPVKSLTWSLSGTSAVYDTAVYDTDVYGGANTITSVRKRLGFTCRTLRARIRHFQDNKTVTLVKAAFRGEYLTDRLG